MRERTKWILVGVMLGLIASVVVADLILSLLLWAQVHTLQGTPTARRSLPCEAIPVRFVLEEPICADKLLRAMNVTNVHIVANSSELERTQSELVAKVNDSRNRFANQARVR